MQLTPDARRRRATAWIGYIAVTAIDDALARLDELGGRVLMGPDHMESIGHMAMVTDPQGAPFYLIQTEGEASQSFARYEARQAIAHGMNWSPMTPCRGCVLLRSGGWRKANAWIWARWASTRCMRLATTHWAR